MIDTLLKRYPLISDQVDVREVQIVLEALLGVLKDTDCGDVVEFGCYAGTTSLFISRVLSMQKTTREFHVYDSFEGLPEKRAEDQSRAGDQFAPGELRATKKQFVLNFKKAGLPLPHIHKGWFGDLVSNDIPSTISLAFLDGDYYESVMSPLKLIWPRLVPGAVVIVDDYVNEALPGAAKAVDEWLIMHSTRGFRVEHSLVVIKPKILT